MSPRLAHRKWYCSRLSVLAILSDQFHVKYVEIEENRRSSVTILTLL
jgi:hypothetical protein